MGRDQPKPYQGVKYEKLSKIIFFLCVISRKPSVQPISRKQNARLHEGYALKIFKLIKYNLQPHLTFL